MLICRAHENEICLHEWVLVVRADDPLVEVSNDGENIVYKIKQTMYLKEICPRDPLTSI